MDLPCAADGKTWTLARLLEGGVVGSDLSEVLLHSDRPIRRLVALTGAEGGGDLCFFADPKLFAHLLALPKDVLCIVSKEQAAMARARGAKAGMVEVGDAKQVWCKMVERIFPDLTVREHTLHPTAVRGEGVVLHEPVSVGAYTVLEDGVEIGAGTIIESHCLVRTGTRIGAGCRIGAGSVIAHADIGDGVVVHEHCAIGGKEFGIVRDERHIPRAFPQLGRVVIGDASEIFKGTTIGRGALEDTTIGKHVKIGCNSMISHNCHIGDCTILSPHCGLAGSTRIGHYVTVGAGLITGQNVVIGDRVGIGGKCAFWPHITIGEGVQIMNDSTAERSLKGDGVVFFGRPARPLRKELRRRKNIDRLAE